MANGGIKWTIEEIELLYDVYPSGGIEAAVEAIPNHSRGAIYQGACVLGIRCGSVYSKNRTQGTGVPEYSDYFAPAWKQWVHSAEPGVAPQARAW